MADAQSETQTLPFRAKLFAAVFAVVVLSVLMSMMDAVRPPYVGWRVELVAGIVLSTPLVLALFVERPIRGD